MKRIIIAISLLVLLTTVNAKQDTTSNEVVKLGYNPTYDIWYFLPTGRPDDVPDYVKDAYEERKVGGVCFKSPDNWFFCATGKKITPK
ncbi:uncharacterized protein LOC116805779 [Drosophila grimshawi]|uniref:uncharacterized protein LOC116805779 n=1 Tax=Drosophila grimshawi TaxID=7222 RepID=UPI000C871051|nr:uncharacterized protein LOC116805779 [Drosophila grimshawi]